MITVQAVFKPTMHCEYYGGQSLNPKKLSWGSNRQPLDNQSNALTTTPPQSARLLPALLLVPLQLYIVTTVHRDYLHSARNMYAEKKSCLNMSLDLFWILK